MKKIKQATKNLLLVYSKTNGIMLDDKTNNDKIEIGNKLKFSVDTISEISPSESKKTIKNKLIEKKNQENNEYSISEYNNNSTFNFDVKNTESEKINQTNNFEIDTTLINNNCDKDEKLEKYNQNNNNFKNNLSNKKINNNIENNVKSSDEWFENFLHQDRIINCELFPNEKLNDNKYLKNNPSSDTEKEFNDTKKIINNSEDEKPKKTKSISKFSNNLSISYISSMVFYSSYDNLNEITKYKLYKDLTLQEKIKKFLLDECFPKANILFSSDRQSIKNDSHILKTTNSFINSKMKQKFIKRCGKSLDVQTINNFKFKENNQQITDSSLMKYSQSSIKNCRDQSQFESNLLYRPNKKQRKSLIFKSASFFQSVKKNNPNINSLEKIKDVEKKEGKKLRNTLIKANNFQSEKKKINYMNVISHNISENRQTLKNPCEFYAGFFANIIEKQKNVGVKSKQILKRFKSLNFNDNAIHKNKTDIKLENNFNALKKNDTLRKNSTDIMDKH